MSQPNLYWIYFIRDIKVLNKKQIGLHEVVITRSLVLEVWDRLVNEN
jgi:hypothetical protein